MQNKLKKSLIYILSVCVALCFCVILCAEKATAEGSDDITITVQTGYSQNDLPNGVEGCTYPIFDYSATDSNGNAIKDVVISVYYDVNADTKFNQVTDDVLVVVEQNRFHTDNAGTYVIEYLASKGINTKIERIFVEVVAEENYVAPNYVINSTIVSAAQTGNKVYLPDGLLVSSEIFGATQLKMQITYNGQYDCGEVEINAFDPRIKYFTPIVSGEYTVDYVITNVLGDEEAVTVSKTISVTDGDKPMIIAPSIPDVYIVGEKYKLPYVEAVQYYNGKIIYVPVSITFNGVAVGEDMILTPTESGNFQLIFTAENIIDNGQDANLICDVVVNAIEEDKPYVDRLMKFDGFNGFYRTENDEDLENEVYVLEVDGSQETAQMSFKNKIAVQFLHLGIGVEPKYNNYNYVDFIITDSQNSNEQIIVSIKKASGGVAQLYLNGFYVKDFGTGSFESAIELLEFKYDFENKTLLDGLDEFFTDIKSYVDGGEFLGFSSGSVFVKLVMGGITDRSQLKLSILGSYYVPGTPKESTKPKIVFENTVTDIIASTVDIYQTITIKKYAAFDLLDQDVKTYLTIIAPDRTVKVDNFLMTGDFDFKVDQYGTYRLEYTFIDVGGRSREVTGMVQVIDRVAPTVVKLPTFAFSVKKGATYKFPEIEFADNAEGDITVLVYLTYGNYQKVLVEKNTFRFMEAGDYTVKYCAVDAAGNRTIVSYNIVCK